MESEIMEINNKKELLNKIIEFNKRYSINYNFMRSKEIKNKLEKNIYFIKEENKINLEEERIRELVSELSFNNFKEVEKIYN